ncbi:MAG: NusG domain II-containing protein [Gammaproteobacteria bacterium]|nr:NusG domain II-containing protein [Gammaproteobacteria bacterium]
MKIMTRADMIVVALAVALLPWLYLSYWAPATQGDEIRILVNGKERMTVSLHQKHQLTIEGTLGTSIIDIHDGKARFVASPCRGKQCVHTGWVSHSGESATCLPNRVSVLVAGNEQRFDSIVF